MKLIHLVILNERVAMYLQMHLCLAQTYHSTYSCKKRVQPSDAALLIFR